MEPWARRRKPTASATMPAPMRAKLTGVHRSDGGRSCFGCRWVLRRVCGMGPKLIKRASGATTGAGVAGRWLGGRPVGGGDRAPGGRAAGRQAGGRAGGRAGRRAGGRAGRRAGGQAGGRPGGCNTTIGARAGDDCSVEGAMRGRRYAGRCWQSLPVVLTSPDATNPTTDRPPRPDCSVASSPRAASPTGHTSRRSHRADETPALTCRYEGRSGSSFNQYAGSSGGSVWRSVSILSRSRRRRTAKRTTRTTAAMSQKNMEWPSRTPQP
jgi:hypothetical protein